MTHGNNISPLEIALDFAASKHWGQKDKSGQPYIFHPIRVAFIIQKEFTTYPEKLPAGITLDDLMVAGLLHDVVEDCGVTLDQIEEKFGKTVRDIVDGVTRRYITADKKERYIEDFIYRAKAHPGSRIVKIADLHHNMSRINNLPESERSIINRYLRAERILNDVE
jgi:GTP diphosphokinase / guanosine-3',5'-bis(diphosphate) 3'-diphosphatase